MMKKDIHTFLESIKEEPLKHIEALVNIESSSHDKEGVDRAGAYMARELERIGFRIERKPQQNVGDQVLARRLFGGRGKVLFSDIWTRSGQKEP